jgi:hypothetical protein
MAIYAGLALGGYVLRHLNIFGHQSPTTPPPTPSPTPSGSRGSGNPILDKVLSVVEDQLTQMLTDAAKRFVQPKT